MKLTLLFGFRNRDAERVRRSLDSLANQSDKNFDVIFVDYGSDEPLRNTIQQLTSNYTFCKYIYNDTRGRPWNRSHALNTGLRLASGDFVFISDIDILFHPDFIRATQEMKQEQCAIFFSMWYLPQNFDFNNLFHRTVGQISEPEALGQSLVSRKILMQLGGYDEFYSFWGQEDNDLEQRLRKAGVETQLYSTRQLLLHQWHPRLLYDNIAYPKAWGVLQQDYFSFNAHKTIRNEKEEWGRCYDETERPAWKLLNEPGVFFTEMDCGRDFFCYFLQQWMRDAKEKDQLALSWNSLPSKTFDRSRATRFARWLQQAYDFFDLPFSIQNKFSFLYSNPLEIRDAVARLMLANRHYIFDYAWVVSEDTFKLTLVR
jgi:glycosyltransferase involved in cell wall biosynthesis